MTGFARTGEKWIRVRGIELLSARSVNRPAAWRLDRPCHGKDKAGRGGDMYIETGLIDPDVLAVCRGLTDKGFAAYLVGGAVRDLLRGLAPGDWDVATSARPEQVRALFPGSLPTGIRYGTVTVRLGGSRVEVTTLRGEGAYGDGRHPDQVVFGSSIEDDLARRDFTVNAMAYDPETGRLIDPHGGLRDLRRGILRTVGRPGRRFAEDALRMLRFYRFVATLGLRPARAAERAMDPTLLGRISPERIRDELFRMLLASAPGPALAGLAATGLLARIVPELPAEPADRVLRHSLAAAEAIRPELHLRLAALLHDIGKPATRTVVRGEIHFYGHDEVGAEMAGAVLARLRCPTRLAEIVRVLVRLHMFQLPAQAGDAALRRLLHKAGSPRRLRDLVELRRADIIATGGAYWRAAGSWRELRRRVEEVLAAGNGFSLRDLAVDGRDVMRALGIGPGPEVGRILRGLLERVLDDPSLNDEERLLSLAREITSRNTAEGPALAERGDRQPPS